MLADPKAFEYTDGIGMHWYWDERIETPVGLDNIHNEYPSKFMMYTESCAGFEPLTQVHTYLGTN